MKKDVAYILLIIVSILVFIEVVVSYREKYTRVQDYYIDKLNALSVHSDSLRHENDNILLENSRMRRDIIELKRLYNEKTYELSRIRAIRSDIDSVYNNITIMQIDSIFSTLN